MVKTIPIEELEAEMSPKARKLAKKKCEELRAEMLLNEVRKLQGITQVELAEALGVKQASVSQMENSDDMQITTLRKIVNAMGGTLHLSIEIPGKGEFSILPQFKPAK